MGIIDLFGSIWQLDSKNMSIVLSQVSWNNSSKGRSSCWSIFKPVYPKTQPAHIHSTQPESSSQFLTVLPFHGTSPNFAFFCLRSYLLPWWHLPRQDGKARQRDKLLSKITSKILRSTDKKWPVWIGGMDLVARPSFSYVSFNSQKIIIINFIKFEKWKNKYDVDTSY